MRYAQGGGLTAEGRRRREQVRLAGVELFEQRVAAADIAAELRVTERSVRRWRQSWLTGGLPGLASKGQGARCRLDEPQLAELEIALEAGPLAAGYQDQRWTLARVRDLIARKFGVRYTVQGQSFEALLAGENNHSQSKRGRPRKQPTNNIPLNKQLATRTNLSMRRSMTNKRSSRCADAIMIRNAALKLLMRKRLFPKDIYREDFFDASDKATGGVRSPLMRT